MLKKDQSGFAYIGLVIGVVLVLFVGGVVAWRVISTKNTEVKTNNSVEAEAKQDSADVMFIYDSENQEGEEQASDSAVQDFDIKSNLKVIHAELEVFFAVNGYYPTASNMESKKWIQANMKGADISVIESFLSSQYEYVPNGCNDTNSRCTGYTLSADLEEDGVGNSDTDGDTADYIKESLN